MTLNNVTGNQKTDEWYTSPETVKICLELLAPTVGSTICCPFDTKDSWFVKLLQERGHKVIYGINDWLENDYEYDFAVTNPPFSIKDKVILKAFQSGKPTVLVLPIDSLSGVRRHEMYKTYGYPTIYIPTRRVNYVDGTGKNRKSTHFTSIFIKLNSGRTDLIWE